MAEDEPDMGEIWKQHKKERQEKRASNRDYSPKLLNKAGIFFEACNHGAHLRVRHGGAVIDFWPGTGYWKTSTGTKGRGVRNLIKFIEANNENRS